MRSDRQRLLDALDQIAMVQTFAGTGRDDFFGNALVQSAILYRLALLGEACRGLSEATRRSRPEVPWEQIIAFRNVLVHQYFGVDLDLVWTVLTEDIPALRQSLTAILNSLPR